MSPDSLAIWTSLGANMKVFKPSVEAIICKRYIALYNKGSANCEDSGDEL